MIARVVGVVFACLCLPALVYGQVKTETEPNNSRPQAQEIRLGDTVQGTLQPGNDEDFFKFTVNAPARQELQIDLTTTSAVAVHLQVQDTRGTRIWQIDQAPKGPQASVTGLVLGQGVYYVRVWGPNAAPTDQYTFTIKALGPWRENTEAEPNDEFTEASEMRLDAPISGRVNRENDVDVYVLKIPDVTRDILVFQLAGLPHGAWEMRLFDQKRTSLQETVRSDPGTDVLVRMRMRPGTYYVRVAVTRDAKVGAQYTLTATKPDKGPASPAEVTQALTKALGWLAKSQTKDGSWTGQNHDLGYTGLALMAFLGGKCVKQDYSANVKRAVAYLKSIYTPTSKFPAGSKEAATLGGRFGRQGTMYDHAIVTLALTEALVDTNDSSLEPIIQDALNVIIRVQNTEHKPQILKGPVKPGTRDYGGWRYNPEQIDSDLSITAWQVLALKAAVNAGFSIPDYVLPAAAGYTRSLQGKRDGSFAYQSPQPDGQSSARAGVGAFVLQLCDAPKDPAIPPALRFMQDNPPRWNAENPGGGYPFYYWYYGTRAMYVAGGDEWRIWEDWMCRLLVDHQNPDGGWIGASAERDLNVYRTALGALMLEFCCGQVPIYLSPVKRVVPGTIAVNYEKGPGQQAAEQAVEIIMDASNSMTGMVGKETKIAAARRVLTQTINGLPNAMRVGFRVYGHRYPIDDYAKACADTELLAPIGPVNKPALVALVNKIQTKGRTPLVLSVLDAIKDFEKLPNVNGNIILVTDGIESCKGDIKSIAPAIRKAGLDLQVNIVGFDIREAGGRQELESIASSTGGRYFDAKDPKALLTALQTSLTTEYVILDAAGKEVGKGVVGGPGARLPAGSYTVRVLVGPKPLEAKATVKPGAAQTFTLRKAKGQWVLE